MVDHSSTTRVIGDPRGPIRVLIAEDNPEDAELVQRELRRSGLHGPAVVARNAQSFQAALVDHRPDLILSDFTMPAFDGLQALDLARTLCPDVPFIFVSGTIGEERAIESMKRGATDYVLKGHLSRLGSAALKAIEVSRMAVQKRQLEEQLRQAQKMEVVGKLAGGVAHDFNNILTAILGYGDLVLGSLPPGSPLHSQVSEMRGAAERGARLTRQLLEFSRKQVVETTYLDLNEVLRNMDGMLRRLIGEDIDLSVDPGPDLWTLRADRGQIEQVVMNLVVNARDAMSNGGRITIVTRNERGAVGVPMPGHSSASYVCLEVADSGHGMDPDVKSHLFEPFFTTKGVGKGTGLGLSTVYGIVTKFGGLISIDSEVGQGTVVTIRFPKASIEASVRIPPSVATAEVRGNETILLAEDDSSVRRFIREVLTSSGFKVFEARDAREAQKIAEQPGIRIDLLIADSVMPVMSGPELALHVARLHPKARILVISGYLDRTEEADGVRGPSLSFLQRPFASADLLKKAREVLGEQVQ